MAPTGGEVAILDAEGRERSIHKIVFGAVLSVKDGDAVTKGQRLADWDPFTRPIITDKAGVVKFQDLLDGKTLREEVDDATGIAQKVVAEYKSRRAKEDLRPRVTLLDEASGEAGRYLLPAGAILSVAEGQEVAAGDVLARMPREAAKTRDITGGLPRVAELFEARVPKDNGIIAKADGRIVFAKDYKAKRRVELHPEEEGAEPIVYLLPKSRHIAVQEGDMVRRGDYIVDGPANPHDILEVLGVEKMAEYLCTEVQEVYRLQGVKINDKHIEVIVRQMLQKVEITDDGDSTLLKGEQVDREEMDAVNAKLIAEGKRPAEGKPVLLGITKASLQTKSFISAASFQETTRVLTEAAVQGKSDTLLGLKENVIVGRLIPAGTGAAHGRLRVAASSRDAALRAQQAALAAATEAAKADA
jgi:DNA-directed RNA polymerase subunit beta'